MNVYFRFQFCFGTSRFFLHFLPKALQLIPRKVDGNFQREPTGELAIISGKISWGVA